MLIAITGGIGAGKSVVSRILAAMGYSVYDCDKRARSIIDSSRDILRQISDNISASVVSDDWRLDRSALAGIVFSDGEKLRILNSITHGAVRSDLANWVRERECFEKLLFVETAILYQSGLDRMVDCVWEVTAPKDVRIMRVISRDGADYTSVERRIVSQNISGFEPHRNVREIINDGVTPVLVRVLGLLEETDSVV